MVPLVSANNHERLITPSTAPIGQPRSVTLDREQQTTQSLPDGVALRIACNSVFMNAISFASTFNTPIPLIVEQAALLSIYQKVSPNITVQVTISRHRVRVICDDFIVITDGIHVRIFQEWIASVQEYLLIIR